MFDKLISNFKADLRLKYAQSLFNTLSGLLSHFEKDALVDPSLRNAAIDAVIEVLQEQKDK